VKTPFFRKNNNNGSFWCKSNPDPDRPMRTGVGLWH
jgi:hypothetical protein